MNTNTASLVSTLTTARQHARSVEESARKERLEIERALRMARARGTGDVTEQAQEAQVVAGKTPSLATKIELALRGERAPMNLRELSEALKEPAERVRQAVKKMRGTPCETRSREDATDARQVYNLGTEDDPQWIWVIGDETSPEELGELVRKLISIRPMTFAELTLATGARRGRLSGRIVQMQREGEKLENVGGDQRTYRWFLVPKKRR